LRGAAGVEESTSRLARVEGGGSGLNPSREPHKQPLPLLRADFFDIWRFLINKSKYHPQSTSEEKLTEFFFGRWPRLGTSLTVRYFFARYRYYLSFRGGCSFLFKGGIPTALRRFRQTGGPGRYIAAHTLCRQKGDGASCAVVPKWS